MIRENSPLLPDVSLPDWYPRLPEGFRVLITGASGGLGQALVKMIKASDENCLIGYHYASAKPSFLDSNVIPLGQMFETESDCISVVNNFAEKAGGIDGLVLLSGGISYSGHWMDMPAEDWERDINVNLNQPFYLARAAMRVMSHSGGGRIVLNGTESALHGGSSESLPYAIAKRGTECLVQGLAREGAKDNILVNGIRFGYIASGFHERWHNRSKSEMRKRAELVPLKRPGHPDEASAMIMYLLSGWANFLTGQIFPVTGGDWL